MRKNISNSTRNALLVVLVLILTATYQSAVNPPYELVQASLRQTDNFAVGFGAQNDQADNVDDIPSQFFPTNNQPADNNGIPFPASSYPNNNQPADDIFDDLNKYVNFKADLVALSFSVFNAVDFLVTLLVTLFILPWVPYGQLLHVLLLLVFIFFVASMGLSLALTNSTIGTAVFCIFVDITIILGIFILKNKVRNRKVYRQCIKEFADRVRIRKNTDVKKN